MTSTITNKASHEIIGKLFVVLKDIEWWSTTLHRSSEYAPSFGKAKWKDILLCVDYEPESFAAFVSEEGQLFSMPLADLGGLAPGQPDKWSDIVALLLNQENPAGWKRRYVFKAFRDFLMEMSV